MKRVWIIAIGLSIPLLGGRAVAQPDPPLITDAAWFTWYQNLLSQRLAECPLARAQTYYFSQSGSDGSGDGSQANPWRTLAKAQQVIVAAGPNGNVALLFKRGDVWRETVGIDVSTPNVTIADYGAGEKPLFTTFQPIGAPSAWTPVAGLANIYQRAMAQAVSWVKEDDDLDRPYSRQSSPAGVNTVEGSWYWDSTGVLYIHSRAMSGGGPATDPRVDGKTYEYTRETLAGIIVEGDGSHVENIRTQGWGMALSGVTQQHGIDCRVEGSARAVLVGCESHYGLTHAMVHYSQSGGVATFVDCKAGLTAGWGGDGGSMFNTFAELGGCQTIFHQCTATHGTLPSSAFPSGQRGGMAFYGHTDSYPGHELGLTITYGFVTRDTPFGCSAHGSFYNLTSAGDLQGLRCFMVNDVFEGGVGSGSGFVVGAVNAARVNGAYLNMRPPALSSGVLAGAAAGGWVINCTVGVDCSDQPGDFAMFRGGPNWPSKVHLWNCYLGVRTRPGQVFRLDGTMPSNSQGSDVVNSAIVATGGGQCRPNLTPPPLLHLERGVAPSALRSNAYYGVDSASVTGDSHATALADPEPATSLLSCISPLACRAAYLPAGVVLGYDQRGVAGVRDDIGPVEAFVCANCDHSTVSPALNILDFQCFINKFAAGDPAANCDGSTAPPILNVADFLCFQTAFARGCK